MTWRIWIVAVLLLAGGGASVEPDVPGSTPQRGDLVSITSSTSIGVTEVNAYIVALAALGVDTSALSGTTYGGSLRRIVYKSLTPHGRLVAPSGGVAHPLKIAGAGSS